MLTKELLFKGDKEKTDLLTTPGKIVSYDGSRYSPLVFSLRLILPPLGSIRLE
jgi:hypothetical protein